MPLINLIFASPYFFFNPFFFFFFLPLLLFHLRLRTPELRRKRISTKKKKKVNQSHHLSIRTFFFKLTFCLTSLVVYLRSPKSNHPNFLILSVTYHISRSFQTFLLSFLFYLFFIYLFTFPHPPFWSFLFLPSSTFCHFRRSSGTVVWLRGPIQSTFHLSSVLDAFCHLRLARPCFRVLYHQGIEGKD